MKIKRTIQIPLLALALTLVTGTLTAQTVPPPPDAHGQTTDQAEGGGAPIGGGLFILLGLGAAYGGKKLYDHRKNALEE